MPGVILPIGSERGLGGGDVAAIDTWLAHPSGQTRPNPPSPDGPTPDDTDSDEYEPV